jgi:ABC-type dipeptide/oligopeptide/nickel transport system permease component
MVAVLLLLTFAVFIIQSVLPADPVKAFLGRNSPPEVIEAKREELGYDDPFLEQYVGFLDRTVHGDLGDFLPASLELAATAAVIAGILGTALGLVSVGRRAGSGVVRLLAVVLSAAPTFLLALIGVLVFYRDLASGPFILAFVAGALMFGLAFRGRD